MLQLVPVLLLDFVFAEALVLIGFALGFFVLVYFIMMIYAGMNSWVREVKRMGWCCNPAFDIWYYEHNRRKWVTANFGASTIFAVIFWFLNILWISFSFLPVYGDFIFNVNVIAAFMLGIVILIPIGYGLVRFHSR